MPIFSKWPLFGKSIKNPFFVHEVTEHEACFVLQLGHLKLKNIKSTPIDTIIEVMTVYETLSAGICYYPNAGKGRT